MRKIISAFSFLVIISAFCFCWAMAEKPQVSNRTAIDFKLIDLSGAAVKLSDYKGKVIFLNFFATWCPPCREEMPSLQALYEKMKGKDFEMLAVSLDRAGASVVMPFIKKGGYTFKVLLDPEGRVASQYQIFSIPTTFILNKQGKIVEKVIGARDWSEKSFVDKINKLIHE